MFDPAIVLLISLRTYFLDTPQWDLFLFLVLSAIKYSSQMIFLIIFDLLILSSFNCSMIFNKGKLLIPQQNFTASARFLELWLLFQALPNFIIHWNAVFSYFNNYTMLPKEHKNDSIASTFMWIKWQRQRLSTSIFGI